MHDRSVKRTLSGLLISSSVIGIDSIKPVVAIYQQHALVYCSVSERGKSCDTVTANADGSISIAIKAQELAEEIDLFLYVTLIFARVLCFD